LIDINNKKFNFYEPIDFSFEEIKDDFFTDIIYTISEKYLPLRKQRNMKNQFNNVILNYANQISEEEPQKNIFSGIENILSKNLIVRIDKDFKDVSLVSSNFILLDLNHNQNFTEIENLLNDILERKIIPIVTHPERYEFFSAKKDNKNIKNLKLKGVLFQLSLGSFNSLYGEKIKQISDIFLNHGFYDFIATDSIRNESIDKKFLEISIDNIVKKIGSSQLNEVFYKNPKNIIDKISFNDYGIQTLNDVSQSE